MAITLGALIVVPLGRSISVRAPFTGTLVGDEVATLEYKRNASGIWLASTTLRLDTRATLPGAAGAANPYQNEWRACVEWVLPLIAYDVRVMVTGTGVVGSPQSSLNQTTLTETPTLPGTSLYVDWTNGNDTTGAGSIGNPYKTLQKAHDVAVGATTIYIVGTGVQVGTGAQVLNVTKNSIAVASSVARGIISGEDLRPCIKISGTNFILQNVECKRSIDDCIGFTNVATDPWVDNCYIHDWNADGVGPDQWRAGIGSASGDTVAPAGVVVSRCTLTRRVEVVDNGGGGNGIWIKENVSLKGRHRLFGNTIDMGTLAATADGIGGEPNFGAGAQFGPYCNSEIYGNTVLNGSDDGYEIEGANMNVTMRGNVSNFNGFSLYAVNATVVGPLYMIRNRGRHAPTKTGAFHIKCGSTSDGVICLYHSSFYGPNVAGLDGADGLKQANSGFGNLIARNNVWRADRYMIETTTLQAGSSMDMDYDCLFTSDATRKVKWFNTNYNAATGWQDWRTATGQEPNGLNIDPEAEWVNPAAGDFNLKSGSQLQHGGVVVTGINDANLDDPRGRFEGAAPDLGAVEMATAPPPPPPDPPTENDSAASAAVVVAA